MTLDFKLAMWLALRTLLPQIQLQGCVFHCTQVLWRKAQLINIAKNTDLDKFLNKTNFSLFHSQIQELNLQVAYQNDIAINKFLRKIMSILIPWDHQVTTDSLCKLSDHVNVQWVTSTIHPTKDWSIYGQGIRTNNDIEDGTMH